MGISGCIGTLEEKMKMICNPTNEIDCFLYQLAAYALTGLEEQTSPNGCFGSISSNDSVTNSI